MPWKIVKRGEEWCIYKQGADGNPVGDSLGCHPSEEKAVAQMRALHANEPMAEQQLSTLVAEFKGSFPDVPYAPGIDPAAFQDDPHPFFVTLPIAKVGVTSGNGRHYDLTAVRRIVEQVNEKRPEGGLGHLPRGERATRYDLPALRWVGAMLDERGTAWGKAYVPSYAANVREHFKLAMRANARVATSIYGTEGEHGLSDLNLEKIDLADPERAGIPELAALPKITSEMSTGGGNTVSDDLKLVTELLNGQLQEKTILVAELTTAKKGLEDKVAELTTKLAAAEATGKLVAEIRTAVGADEKADVVKLISELASEVATLREEKAKDERDKLIAKFVAFEALRPTIALHLPADVSGEEAVKKAVAELMARSDIKLIADALVRAKAGPNVIVTELSGNGGKIDLDTFDTPEARAAAQRRTGIG